MDINKYLDKKRRIVDKALLENLPSPRGYPRRLAEAMRYSISVGGKRLRPILMLAIADMLNKPSRQILPAACAAEYAHTSTLILDDLPCMDDSGLRRGKPSLHNKFGESTAILASYALLVLSFELLAGNAKNISHDADLIFRVTESMSAALGFGGICAGQYLDLESGSKKITMNTLAYLHRHKTADLFAACCRIATYLSGASSVQSRALGRYGDYIGLAFQACDDMLSINKTDKELGKETKKDKNAPNFVNLFGSDKAEAALKSYAKQAQAQLDIFGKKADILRHISRYAIERGR